MTSPTAESDGATAKRKRRTGLSDAMLVRHLHEAILDHRLPPGTKLTEDALGEVFGVSRTVVRKALLRLAQERIVRIRPNRGAIVASPTVKEARDVFEARRVVEAAVVRSTVTAADRPGLEALRRQVAEERAAFEQGDRRRSILLSGQFHLDLAVLADNGVLSTFLQELVSRTSLIIALYESPGTAVCSSEEHFGLIDAIAAGDVERSVALMDAHLLTCRNKLNLEGGATTVDLTRIFADVLGTPRP